jgi:hypothetical protein
MSTLVVGSKTSARRLVVAGLAWTGFLVPLGAFLGFAGASAPKPLTREPVDFERGRMPANPSTIPTSRLDPRLGHVAAVLSGLGTEVFCWSPGDWKLRQRTRQPRDRLGAWRAYTGGSPRMIHLSPEVCAQLSVIAADLPLLAGEHSPDALAWSVAALGHEAQHVAGIRDEVQAECYGMQSIARAARLLGRTPREGQYLATVYWKHWYVWLTPSYRSRECRNGGRLDLRKADRSWP